MGSWYNNKTDDGVWWGDEFDSRQDAIDDGVEQYRCALNNEDSELFDDDYEGDYPSGIFFVGEGEKYIPSIDVDSIIGRLREDAYNQCGEVAEDFLWWDWQDRDEMEEAYNSLKTKLELELDSWLFVNGLYPTFFSIKNVEEIDANDYI